MQWLDAIPDWSPEIFTWFVPGLVTGIVVCVVAWLGFRGWRWSRNKRHNQIHIANDNGDVWLSERAVRDIVVTSLADFPHIAVHRVQVGRAGKAYTIRVDFQFDPRMPFNSGKEAMKDKIREDFRERIGVEAEIHPILNVIAAEAPDDLPARQEPSPPRAEG